MTADLYHEAQTPHTKMSHESAICRTQEETTGKDANKQNMITTILRVNSPSTRAISIGMTLAAVILGKSLPASAFPCAPSQAAAIRGLFPKIRMPRINLGKAVKAAAYPVTKAVVNGGKTAYEGGKKGVAVYEAWQGLSSKAGGIAGMPRPR